MRNTILVWMIWLVAAIFYAFQYILRVLPNLMLNDILEKFHIDAGIFGQYSGLYYIGYALAHLPLGLMLDRYGTKKVLPLCVLVTVAGLLPLVYSSHWIYPCIGRILLGLGSSAAILGLFKVILYCFGEDKFTRMLGVSVVIGLCGAIFGGTPVSILISIIGWETVVKLAMVTGLVLAFTLYLTLPVTDNTNENQTKTSVLADLKLLFTNKQVILMCVFAGLMVGPLEGFADVWGTVFIKASYDLNKTTADGLPSFIFWGMLCGSFVLPYVCDKTGRYFEMVVLCAAIMATSFILMLSGLVPANMLFVNLFVIGIFCAYQIPIIYKISTFVPFRMMGLATAFVNMVIMIFGYMFHSVIGKVLTIVSTGDVIDGVPVYSRSDFAGALAIIPIAQIVAALGILLVLYNMKLKQQHKNDIFIANPI